MCLAIFKPPGVTISEDYLRAGWQHNPDGAGFAYIDGKKVKFSKGHMAVKDFMSAYLEKAEEFASSPFAIHFRIRSQGSRDESNTHPFPFKHGVMIHNGNIGGTGSKYNEGKSDTALFMEKFGDRLSYKLMTEGKSDLENAIGVGNKMVFLFNNGKHIILNERVGNWKDGAWYSNASYVPRTLVSGQYGSDNYGMYGD